MTGHFEKGMWIEDPKPVPEPMTMKVKIDIDDTQVRAVRASIDEMTAALERFGKLTGIITCPPNAEDLAYARRVIEEWGKQ